MKRILLPASGAVLATGLLAAGLAGTAQADDTIATDPLAKTAAQAAEIVDFWTKSDHAALKGAVAFNPDALEVSKIKSGGGYSADTKPGSTAPIGEEKKTTVKVQNVNLPKTIGKVFFEGRDGKLYWCSGTSIQSQYRNLVATAGHCVYDIAANDEVVSRWVFVPGYYQGKTPWGIYVGKQAFTHYDFDVYEDFDRDYAFVTVYNGIGLNYSKVETKQVTKSEYDNFKGKKEVKSVELKDIPNGKTAKQQYEEGLDKYGPNSGFRVENYKEADPAGGNFETSVPTNDVVEVTELQWNSAPAANENPALWKNGDKGATKDTPLTEAEYKKLLDDKAAGKVKGKVFKDDLGDYWLRQYYVIQWYKITEGARYFHDSFFIYPGGDLSLADKGRLGDNVGGQGFAWNQPAGKYVRTFGYPYGPHLDGNKPFTGVTPKWCYGKTSKNALLIPSKKVEEQQSLKCTVTAGYDGGPWLYKYSNAKRLGYVNGVTSLIADTDDNKRYDTITSAYFDGETAAIYKAAAAVWSGKLVK